MQMRRRTTGFRFLLSLLTALYVLSPTGAWAATETIDLSGFGGTYGDAPIQIGAGSDDIVLKGKFTGTGGSGGVNIVAVSSDGYDGTITLDGMSIDLSRKNYTFSPIFLYSGASPKIVLSGDSELTSYYSAALYVSQDAEVNISGAGRLTARGAYESAAIGGNYNMSSGTIVIDGGYIVAYGGGEGSGYPAAIGGGGGGNLTTATVVINGGVVVAEAYTVEAGGRVLSAYDIGPGMDGDFAHGTASVTITGGSVSADKVYEPKDAAGVAVVSVDRALGANRALQTLSFDLGGRAYTFMVPDDGNIRVWVPAASKDAVPDAVLTAISLTAASNGTSIVLTAAPTGGTPTGYDWHRADVPDGAFLPLGTTTAAAYTDTTADLAKSYDYKVIAKGVWNFGETTATARYDAGNPIPLPAGVTIALLTNDPDLPAGMTPLGALPTGSTAVALDAGDAGVDTGQFALLGSIRFDVPVSDDEILALAHSAAAATMAAADPTFSDWASLTAAEREELLNALERERGFKAVYEYVNVAGKSTVTLIGADSALTDDNGDTLTWARAVAQGVAALDANGITVRYIVADGADEPSVHKSFIMMPDGKKDNRLIDPLWFAMNDPQTPSGSGGVGCSAGIGLLALMTAAGAAAAFRKKY